VKLVGICYDEMGPKYASLPYKVTKTENLSLDYKTVTFSEMRKLINAIK